MHILLLGTLLLALPPGRYIGVVAERTPVQRVDLDLRADGTAVFGGARYRWRRSGPLLRLVASDGDLTLEVDGQCLEGPPFGRVCLSPAPPLPETPPPTPVPPRPEAWRGAWAHTASGGTLVIELGGDGRYVMRQPGLVTRGGWRGDDGGFTLVPDGGEPLTYAARRQGADLLVGGGDLPTEVRFRRHRAGRYNPVPSPAEGRPGREP